MRYAGCYVTFDDEQEQTLRSALRERLELHRREELSAYVAFLWNTERMLSDGLTANEAGELLSGIRRLYDRTARRTLPYITPTLTTLTDAQIDELVDNIQQRNQDFREKYLADDTEVRHQNRVEGIVERLQRWTGNLTKEQLDERLRSSTDPVPRWFEYRHTKQQEFIALLRRKPSDEQLLEFLVNWWIDQSDLPTQTRAASQQLYAEVADIVAELDSTLSSRQRELALETLADYRSMFETVATRNAGESASTERKHRINDE